MAKTDGTDIITNIAKIDQPTTLQQWIESKRDIIEKALPKGFDVDRMIRVVIGSLRDNPNLAKCTPISFISGIMQSIQLGLEPNTILGHACLIPYWNSKLGCYEAQFQRMYRGLLDMAYRTGEFKEIYAQEVFKGDHFEFMYGTEKWIRHIPADKPVLDKKGNPIVIYVYAVYKTIKGGMHFVVWTKEKLDHHKERYSPAVKKDSFSAWNVSENSMYKKTVLKDLLNYADISVEFRKQLQTDEIVKREIRPDMMTTVKSIYEFNPDDLAGIEKEKLEEGKKEDKGKKEIKKEEENKESSKKLVTEKQLKRYYAMVKEADLDIEKADEHLKKKYGVEHKNELTMAQIDEIFEALEKKIQDKKDADQVEKDFEQSEQSKLNV